MIPKAVPSLDPGPARPGTAVGADLGASLVKLAVRRPGGELELRLLPTSAPELVASEIESLGAAHVGLTGGGAARLAGRLGGAATASEFDAWAVGARVLLVREGHTAPDRFLLVSLGTGTSAILVAEGRAVRVGGTALGGGTVAGLANALLGITDFDALARLAQAGDRSRVDLQVADIYPQGDLQLLGEMNASSFAKLAGPGPQPAPGPEDLARALMGLVAENVGLLCGGLATAAGVDRIVYGGGTLRGNPVIGDILRLLARVHGCDATILEAGAFAGAVGALTLAGGG